MKNYGTLKHFNKYKVKNCVPTKYADISLVEAQNVLLENALGDKDNQHFIFVSNSCIPLKSFEHVYQNLDNAHSYFNMAPQSQCFPRANCALDYIDRSLIQKASQWCILNRKHAELMINEKDYMQWFMIVPDEHCYITKIFVKNLQDEIITTLNQSNNATTFINWKGMDYRYPSLADLKNYDSISDDELYYLLDSRCFFGRKFNIGCQHSLINNKRYIDSISHPLN